MSLVPLTSSQAHSPRCILSSVCAEPSPLIFLIWSAPVQAFSPDSVTMPNRGRRNSRKVSRTRQSLAANPLNNEQTNYRSLATEALCLLLAQHDLVQTSTRQQLVARLGAHLNNSPSGVVTVTDTSSSAKSLPQEELAAAQIISSFIDRNSPHGKMAVNSSTASSHYSHRIPVNGPKSSYAKSHPGWWTPTTTEHRYTTAELSCLQPIGPSQRRSFPSRFSPTLAG